MPLHFMPLVWYIIYYNNIIKCRDESTELVGLILDNTI